MKQVKEMPQEGQFVAIWEHEGGLWSCVYQWQHGELFAYNVHPEDYDEWTLAGNGSHNTEGLLLLSATYFVKQ